MDCNPSSERNRFWGQVHPFIQRGPPLHPRQFIFPASWIALLWSFRTIRVASISGLVRFQVKWSIFWSSKSLEKNDCLGWRGGPLLMKGWTQLFGTWILKENRVLLPGYECWCHKSIFASKYRLILNEFCLGFCISITYGYIPTSWSQRNALKTAKSCENSWF